MKEHYVSYDCAVKLKELGFDWECNRYYTNGYANHDPEDLTRVIKLHYDSPHNYNRIISADGACYSAPRLDQAQAWLREVKGIIVWVSPEFYEGDALEDVKWYFYAQPLQDLRSQRGGKFDCGYYSTYELALSAGIDAAIEILTNKQTDK